MALNCQICGSETSGFGQTDFNRSAADVFECARQYPVSDQMVDYVRCQSCGLIETHFFDDWSADDFKRLIYNAEYIKADPPFLSDRPQKIARFLGNTFQDYKDLSFLDFGGGTGLTADLLRKSGFKNAVSYDPFYQNDKPSGVFDIVTAFEVVEHVPDQNDLLAQIAQFCSEDTVFLFSTLLQPKDIDEVGIDWWYIGPRNGHVVFHTAESLKQWLKKHSFQCASISQELHIALRKPSPLCDYLKNIDLKDFQVSDIPKTHHRNW